MNKIIKYISSKEPDVIINELLSKRKDNIEEIIPKLKDSILEYETLVNDIILKLRKSSGNHYEGELLTCKLDYLGIKKGHKVILTRLEGGKAYINASTEVSLTDIDKYFENQKIA